jgi:hypothetical protein
MFGRAAVPVFAATKIGGGAGLFARGIEPVSTVLSSGMGDSFPARRNDSRSGLVLGLLVDFPG